MARPTLEDPLNGLDCFLYELRTDSWFRVIDDSGFQGHTIFFHTSYAYTGYENFRLRAVIISRS